MLDGRCHCGAITLGFTSARSPAELPVRICGCTFCARHRPRYTADPDGEVTIAFAEAAISRYRFGLGLADFLICRTCGVFVAAYDPSLARAVVNLDVLADPAAFVGEPVRFTAYDSEDAAARTARRARGWTPARLIAT